MKFKSNHSQFLQTLSKTSTSKDSHAGKIYTLKTNKIALLRERVSSKPATNENIRMYNLYFRKYPENSFFGIRLKRTVSWRIKNTREFEIRNVPLKFEFKKTP